jgi:hypothetical protein
MAVTAIWGEFIYHDASHTPQMAGYLGKIITPFSTENVQKSLFDNCKLTSNFIKLNSINCVKCSEGDI